LLANHNNNHEDLFLAILEKKKRIAAKTHEPKRSDENTEQRNRSVESGSPGTCHDAR
jgi:hypothetical protein